MRRREEDKIKETNAPVNKTFPNKNVLVNSAYFNLLKISQPRSSSPSAANVLLELLIPKVFIILFLK